MSKISKEGVSEPQVPSTRKSSGSPYKSLSLPDVISENKIRAVNYDTKNHIAILTQMHGSIWPRVIPYCLCNVFLVVTLHSLKKRGHDLSFSDRGHTFMSMMVSFLVVTRTNIAYSRFMEAREHLNVAMRNCRELIQHAVTFTRYDTSRSAKIWRAEVARRTIVLLRTVVSVLEYQTYGVHCWKIPELTKEEKQALLVSVGQSNERSPMVLTMFMRSTIASQVEYLTQPIHINKELRLYQFVSDFVTAYHGLTKLVSTQDFTTRGSHMALHILIHLSPLIFEKITTPFPFPLVQMARTFLFIWIFTLPFALVNDMVKLPALIIVVFFITFGASFFIVKIHITLKVLERDYNPNSLGFLGLEFLSIQLDDPFGDDPNDFDVLGLAQVVFEDVYISIYDVDGKEAADAIRRGLEASTAIFKAQTLKEQYRHKRYTSADAWQYAASFENIVGRNKSMLLDASMLQSREGHYDPNEAEKKLMNGFVTTSTSLYGSTSSQSSKSSSTITLK